MAEVSQGVVLIGDLIGSRKSIDRQALHDSLKRLLAETNSATPSLVPARATVGDEFQASFATLQQAVDFVYRFRMRGEPEVQARFGLGAGPYVVLERNVLIEDGEAYWNARSAIERVKTRETTSLRRSRCSYEPLDAAVEAALLSLDAILGAWSARSMRVLDALVSGHTQREVAVALGVSPSAISQRVRSDQIDAVVRILELLTESQGSIVRRT